MVRPLSSDPILDARSAKKTRTNSVQITDSDPRYCLPTSLTSDQRFELQNSKPLKKLLQNLAMAQSSNMPSPSTVSMGQALLLSFASKLIDIQKSSHSGLLENNEQNAKNKQADEEVSPGVNGNGRKEPQEKNLSSSASDDFALQLQILMHKSIMQLHQAAAAQAQAQQSTTDSAHHNNGFHGQIPPRLPMQQQQSPGSMSPTGSEENGEGDADNDLPRTHECVQCGKSFTSNHQLVQHVRVHTGEKPYKCSYCERRFKQLSHVQQHTRLHTGERPYRCHVTECGRAFIQLSNLQQHLRNHDAQIERSKNRPFRCNLCGKGFATESSLRTHNIKQHPPTAATNSQDPVPAICPVCHKYFLGAEALMDHMKHTHKDPNASGVATKRRTANHPCPICGKQYVNEGCLRKHMTCHPEAARLSLTSASVTTALRMAPCSVCQAVFAHETGLLAHMEQMRSDPKHQFAAQYYLTRAASEMAAATTAFNALANSHSFGVSTQSLISSNPAHVPTSSSSPSGSESSGGRFSCPPLPHDRDMTLRLRQSSPVNFHRSSTNHSSQSAANVALNYSHGNYNGNGEMFPRIPKKEPGPGPGPALSSHDLRNFMHYQAQGAHRLSSTGQIRNSNSYGHPTTIVGQNGHGHESSGHSHSHQSPYYSPANIPNSQQGFSEALLFRQLDPRTLGFSFPPPTHS